ncbi:ABC transporter ATP-binding protein [Rhodobacter sp. 24-YEA-8]|uniref:oligopeptide/dipeptide ABC transporter ATP-binding protein n=1 Tax=Rhodobacter sp. 24-YEA-8 TaxID=1884310 RepID=UPI00089884E7|nr:ABC transporter ATP-binding protein [Rhodobacter sp. 24-YEA-8]SED73603.1 peptide/nickel transport system ATP-binding protein [Rhodobacter sp. 24-YEA-8]
MTPLLSVRNLDVSYPVGGLMTKLRGAGQLQIVAGVSFDLARGETMALVGESGSGKTTLARAIAGLGGLVSGEIRFDGAPLNTSGRQIRREIAFIFQDAVSSLSPRLTVRALLREPFAIHGIQYPEGEVERLLRLVGLPATIAERRPHELSGGQARRVGVARALALKPRLVIADEPTAGLDVSVQSEVLNLLNDLRTRLGLSLLIITHNLNIVRHIADRMAIMYLGRFVETGDTAPVFAHPHHPYTAALLSANPIIDPEARKTRLYLKGEVPGLVRRPKGCEFHSRCPFVQDLCRSTPPSLQEDGPVSYTCHFPMEASVNA